VIKYNGDAIPCCLHRVGEQYSEKAEQRTLGNVFETGVRDVWNSSAYRAVRRLVLSPAAIRAEETLRRSFCNECPRLFDTNCDANLRSAQHYSFEDLYIAEGGGITRRLRTS
jgi:MoaA/NifB/PqqE/SkfB family radical SAM enzyme